VRLDLHDDPAVISMAGELGISENEVVGACVRLWSWANLQTRDGHARVTTAWLDRHAGITGFVMAMQRVGWLTFDEREGMTIPNFDRHNGQSAKARALSADRSRNYRSREAQKVERHAERHAPVTEKSPLEKRREEKRRDTESILTNACPETQNVSGPPLLTYPCDGAIKEWSLTADYLAELAAAFPALDCLAECRKALAWVNASPDRRKTAKGMKRFLTGWLGRAQDRGAGRTHAPPRQETIEDRLARLKEEQCRRHGTSGPSTHPESSS
jgi:hypothetical protein